MIQIGLVDATNNGSGSLDPNLLSETARALSTQAIQHLAPVWGAQCQASVFVMPKSDQVPLGVWPMFLVDSLPPGMGGFHSDNTDQPYAKVIASSNDPTWTLDASHELCEMLVDPQGSRVQSAPAITVTNGVIQGAPGRVNYLVEVADPVEAEQCAYDIDGITVSDFILPNFYDATVKLNTTYSFKGRLTKPQQIYPGGYISWADSNGNWSQILWVDPGAQPTLNVLGSFTGSGSLREWIDNQTPRQKYPDVLKRQEHSHHRRLAQEAAIKRRALYNV